MNNVALLLLAIEREPDDLTAVAALTDALIEERDMVRSEADRYAEKAVQSARDTRDLCAAAELLRPNQPWHAELKRDILHAVGLTHSQMATVVLIPGDTPPLHAEQRQYEVDNWFTNHSITVGALWVTRHWHQHPSLFLMAPPKKNKRMRYR